MGIGGVAEPNYWKLFAQIFQVFFCLKADWGTNLS